jgi:hypothetical protein
MYAPNSSLFTYCSYQEDKWAKSGWRSTSTFFEFRRVKNCTVFVNTDLSECPYLGGARYKSWSQLMAVLLEAYHGVPQCLEAHIRIVGLLWSRSRPSPSIFIVVLECLSFLPFVFCFRLSVRSLITLNGFPEFLLLPHSSPFAVTVALHSI